MDTNNEVFLKPENNTINNNKNHVNKERNIIYIKKNSNKGNNFSNFKENNKINTNYLNNKRKRKKKLIKKINNRIKFNKKLDLLKGNNNSIQNKINNNDTFKYDIFNYDSTFESKIKENIKKYFWKNLIFTKFSGQNKLLSEIINDIEKYENKKNNWKNALTIKKSKIENDFKFENMSSPKEKKRNNNIIIIELDDEDIIDYSKNIYNNNNINNNIENNVNFQNNNINVGESVNINNVNLQKNKINNLTEENEKLLTEIENIKELENESKFLKEFLIKENFFVENKKFYPDNFNDSEIKKEIINQKNLLRQKTSLKLYAILKNIYPYLENNIFQKNITYLEYIAYSINKFLLDKYILIIDLIYLKLIKETIKIKSKKNENKKVDSLDII